MTDISVAEELMSEFASRTGISKPRVGNARYLWTDAFAVFNFLALHELTGRREHLDRALELTGRVHHTLGRHRDDDPRAGWISGLSGSEGERHPTCGGLRIGKPLNERGPSEAFEDRLEWERDGQYFHYLTKWMHALNRVAIATGDAVYNTWAMELADTAHRAFVYQAPDGRRRMYWKMSIDLSRPLVSSMGQHDPLDGFVSCCQLLATCNAVGSPGVPDLTPARAAFRGMCDGATWTTADELGIGGLLTDAWQLIRLTAASALDDSFLLHDVLGDAQRSLRHFAEHHRLDQTAERRLPFREFGLVIGLQAVRAMREAITHDTDRFHDCDALLTRIDALMRYTPLIERIEDFWLDPNQRRAATWTEHLDINSVMLATCLVPHVYLLCKPDLNVNGNLFRPAQASALE